MMQVNFKDLLRDFKNPPAMSRPQYFWFLNHDLNIEEIKRQLDDMKESGAGGAFLHARHGRITPYMSEKWLDICTEAIKYGAEIGLKVWLYDEDGFPSGFVGGETIKPNPKDFSANFIVLNEEFELEPGDSLDVNISFENITSEIFGIVAIEVKETDIGYNLQNYPEKILDISDKYQNGNLKWQAPNDGELWLVLPFIREWNTGAANVLSKKTMERFIEITHEKYYQYLKKKNLDKLLGNTIPGIFTDEPAVMYCIGDKSWRRIIPFTPEMIEEYHNKYDISLLFGLPAMFFDIEGGNTNYRLNYWLLASEFYSTHYFKQIGDWCKQHNIFSTGHLANDSCLYNQVRDQIDWFKNAQYMHLGPSDQLGAIFRGKFESSYGLGETDNMMTPRFAASAGRLYDLPYNISECFGSSGWELSLRNQKKLINWQVANGINLFSPHDYSYSIEGARKRDHPPAFERCSYFDEIKILNDYIGRLCLLFSQKESEIYPRIGVLYGNLTILANMNPMQGNAASHAHDAQAYIIDILQRLHYDFDIIPEDFISSAIIENGLIGDEKNKYDLIILASLNTIHIDTVQKLMEFYENGGNLLFIKKLPYNFYSENKENHGISKFFDILNLNMEKSIKSFETGKNVYSFDDDEIKNWFLETSNDKYGNFGFLQAIKSPIFKNELLDEINSFIFKIKHRGVGVSTYYKDRNLSMENGDFIVRRLNLKTDDNSAIFFLANVSDNQYVDTTIVISNYLQGIKAHRIWESYWIYQLNPLNGVIRQIDHIDIHPDKMGNLRIHWDFEPNESVILLVTQKEVNLNENILSISSTNALKIDENKILSTQILSNWKIVTRNNILNLDNWDVSYSVEKMGIERPSYLRYILNHKISLEIEEIPENLQLILDGDITHNLNSLKLSINGTQIKNLKPGKILDFHMIETENIINSFQKGENVVEIITTGGLSSPMYSLTEPVRLFGDFIVTSKIDSKYYKISKKNDIVLDELLDLKENGFPNYIYPIDYETNFSINKNQLDEFDYFLNLPIQEEPLYKVWLNNELEGHVWFGNYKLKLRNIKEGINKICIRYYPYPIYLFEKTNIPLGVNQQISIEIIRKIP